MKEYFGAISTLHLANDRPVIMAQHCQGYVFQLMAMRDSEWT